MNALAFLSSIVEDIKTEVVMLFFAFLLHWVVFRGYHIRKSHIPKQKQSPKSERCSVNRSTENNPKLVDSCAKRSPNPSRQLLFATLAHDVRRDSRGKEVLTSRIRQELQQVPREEKVNALTHFLQVVVKNRNKRDDLLSIVHLLLEENGLQLTAALGECLLQAHLANGDLDKAQQIIQVMRSAGQQPKLIIFNELLDAAVKKCRKQAWSLIDEMKLCGVKPDPLTCTTLLKTIQANSTSTDMAKVLAVLDDMEKHMDEALLSSIIEACLRAGRPEYLEPLLKQHSIKYIRAESARTYWNIIRAYGAPKDTQGAWDTWREMRSRRISPTSVTLGCMVEALITIGDVEAGYDFVCEMSQDEVCREHMNAVIYGSVMKGFVKQKKFDRVWSLHEEMLDLKLDLSVVTFNTLIDACARAREMSRIPALLESMVSHGIEPNIITYSAVLKGYCQANRMDEALQLFQEMSQTTEFRPDEIMYNTLLDGCARQGLYSKGMALFKEMQQVGLPATNHTLSVLVKLAGRSKRLNRAFELCAEISSKYGFQPNIHVYSNLVHYSVVCQDCRRALEVFEKMVSEGVRPDVRSYESLLRACIAERRGQDASGLLRAAMGLKGVHPKLAGKSRNLLQPQGRLTVELIEHVLAGIAGPCKGRHMAMELLIDLRHVSGLCIDPKLQLRLATQCS